MKCKHCKWLKLNKSYPWCELVLDSPVEDEERDCKHFVRATNADKIRKMSDTELAEFLVSVLDRVTQISICGQQCDTCSNDSEVCKELCLLWLSEEV